MENVSTAPQGDILLDLAAENLYEDATVGQRFANFIIDIIVFYIVVAAVSVVVFAIAEANGVYIAYFYEDTNIIMDRLLGTLFLVILYTLVEGITKGRSVGKYITKTKVIREDGAPLSFRDFLMRSLSRAVPFEPFSAFGGYPWHDKWTNTRVVKTNKIIS